MLSRMTFARITGALVLGALVLLSGASASNRVDASAVNWLNFGNTVDQNRYSSLTQITTDNVSQLGRLFTFDLNKVVPGIKKGQQSYPIVVDGTIYVTSGDDQVFAVNGTSGALVWHSALGIKTTHNVHRTARYVFNRSLLMWYRKSSD